MLIKNKDGNDSDDDAYMYMISLGVVRTRRRVYKPYTLCSNVRADFLHAELFSF